MSFLVLSKEAACRIELAIAKPDAGLPELIETLKLDPKTSFRGADLSGVDFGDLDISGFDFTGADLSGASMAGVRGADHAVGICLDGVIAPPTFTEFDLGYSREDWRYSYEVGHNQQDEEEESWSYLGTLSIAVKRASKVRSLQNQLDLLKTANHIRYEDLRDDQFHEIWAILYSGLISSGDYLNNDIFPQNYNFTLIRFIYGYIKILEGEQRNFELLEFLIDIGLNLVERSSSTKSWRFYALAGDMFFAKSELNKRSKNLKVRSSGKYFNERAVEWYRKELLTHRNPETEKKLITALNRLSVRYRNMGNEKLAADLLAEADALI